MYSFERPKVSNLPDFPHFIPRAIQNSAIDELKLRKEGYSGIASANADYSPLKPENAYLNAASGVSL